jgi:hypothetical protein
MRSISALKLAAAIGAIALLPACAGSSQTATSLVPSSGLAIGAPEERGRGAGPLSTCNDQRGRRARTAHRHQGKLAITQRYVYVADACGSAIDVLNARSYDELGSITSGVNFPDDAFVDPHGDLYVANYSGNNVTEYAPGNWTSPSFTYSANMNTPIAVTADTHGNVYDANGNGSLTPVINEYYENRNISIASCQPISYGFIFGIAVDSRNDVFVAEFDNTLGSFELLEFVGGLNNCGSRTVLPLPSADLGDGGIALDKNANLLIANGGRVEVVDAPSYSTINATIGTGFCFAINVHLNRSNKLAFVTDVSCNTVTVVRYPSGTNVTVLGTGNGLSIPRAAVEQPNAVY